MRLKIFNIFWLSEANSFEEKFEEICQEIINCTKCPLNEEHAIKKSLSRFISTFKTKWIDSKRTEVKFVQINNSWLKGFIEFKNFNKSRGRPQLLF